MIHTLKLVYGIGGTRSQKIINIPDYYRGRVPVTLHMSYLCIIFGMSHLWVIYDEDIVGLEER